MTVVYDLLGYQNRDHGERGVPRYVLNLALALEREAPGLVDQYLVHPSLPLPVGIEPLVSTGRVVRSDRRVESRSPATGGVFLAGTLFDVPNPSLDYVYPHWARTPAWQSVGILYDFIPARFPHWYLSEHNRRNAYNTRMGAVASLDHFLAISEATADDAVELLGVDREQLTVIGAGADGRFHRPALSPEEVAAALVARGEIPGLRPGFILFPTGVDHRKNIERTIEAYGLLPAELRRRHQLVLVCHLDDHGRSLIGGAAGVTEDILVTGFVSDQVLTTLYQGAHLVVFPSLYEGFGLPVLEAMQCGAPVICSDSSSLKEVQTRADARFDPTSTDAIADAMGRLLSDEAARDDLRSQPLPDFSWETAARLTGRVLSRLRHEAERRISLTPPRRRVALVTPLPPQESGIADYAHRLLEELRHHVDITVFVDPDPSEVIAPEGVEVRPISSFEAVSGGGGAFDRVVYLMGNSHFHVTSLDLLRRNPGLVVLHDVRLTGLYYLAELEYPRYSLFGSVGTVLAHFYPHRYRGTLQAESVIPAEEANRFGVFLAREVVAAADEVLVHSEFAATLVELDTGTRPEVPFPLPCPATARGEHHLPGSDDPSRLVISSFGILDQVKAPDVLVEALALIHRSLPGVELNLVGLGPEELIDELRGQAERLGVADHVHIPGRLGHEEFAAAQLATTVAVQLRTFTNGESSAAVTDLLAKGIPTVVSDLGAMAELPDDVVVHVDHPCSAGALAEVLVGLLSDSERRRALSDGAIAYSAMNSYERAARTLLKVLFP